MGLFEVLKVFQIMPVIVLNSNFCNDFIYIKLTEIITIFIKSIKIGSARSLWCLLEKSSVFCHTALLQIHPLSLSFASSKSRELLAYAQLYCRTTVCWKASSTEISSVYVKKKYFSQSQRRSILNCFVIGWNICRRSKFLSH